MFTCIYVCVYVYISISISLSLCIYIYIYIYIHTYLTKHQISGSTSFLRMPREGASQTRISPMNQASGRKTNNVVLISGISTTQIHNVGETQET